MLSDARCPFASLFAEPTRNGLMRPKAVRGSGVKMINMGEIFAHPRLNNVAMERVPLEQSERSRFLLQDGDLLFARQSLVLSGAGKCSIFLGDDEPTTFESHVIRVRLNHAKANPLYYYYYFQSHEGRSAIQSIVEQGAGASGIRATDLAAIDVVCRPIAVQDAIAHILGTLDDKIELNRCMNETLEAMARALFKSWFIDFDPVRAKMAGRDPRLPQHLADLFPNRLVDSELGSIPEGWEVGTIGQEVDVVGGSTPSTKDPSFWNGTINWATPKDLSSLKSPILVETSRKITEKGLDRIGSGLLPRGTVLLSSRAPIGYLVISDVPVAINQGFIAMKCQKRLSATYVWLWAAANMAAILENANGSTFQEISKSNFRPLPVIVPNVSVRKPHDKLMQLLYDHVVKNERQSRTLATLRDTLLPKLISGELAVKDTEKFIGRVV